MITGVLHGTITEIVYLETRGDSYILFRCSVCPVKVQPVTSFSQPVTVLIKQVTPPSFQYSLRLIRLT